MLFYYGFEFKLCINCLIDALEPRTLSENSVLNTHKCVKIYFEKTTLSVPILDEPVKFMCKTCFHVSCDSLSQL